MVVTKMTFAVIVCILFIFSLSIIYFSKKRLNNYENRLYKLLLILNIVGLVFHLLSDIVSYNYDTVPTIISTFVLKTYLIYYFAYGALLLSYLCVIADLKNKKLFIKMLGLFTIALYIIIYFIPQNIYRDFGNMLFYTNGLDVKIIYLLSGIISVLLFLIILIKFKKLKTKKAIPLFLFMVGGTISIFIQKSFPDIVIIDCIEAIITLLMYFTIENPDMAMIEQLNIARDQADKANQAKSEFLSNMSHEIRTPLNAIVGFSQALQEENLPDQAQEEVKDIVRASESLLELVNGILDISKIEANKIEIVDVEYNIYEILDDLVALTKARLGEKPLEFKTYFDQSLPHFLYGDSTRIKQIILNLLTNAVKYTKEGSIEFRVSSIQSNDVCRLIVSVEDTGIGIKKENIDKLFDKFQRLDLEKNITIEGTGLGMAITKRLIELMNGRIMVQSVYGKGSKFTVAIDQKIIHKQVEVQTVKQETTEEIADLTGKRLLIVDDNKLNLKVASRLIEKYKCEINTLLSGIECIEKIKAGEHYDLILMDDMMPNMSGVETLKNLKQIEGFNTPVIALTANAISGMKEKYLQDGFDDYLSKPIDKQELNKVLQKFMV